MNSLQELRERLELLVASAQMVAFHSEAANIAMQQADLRHESRRTEQPM